MSGKFYEEYCLITRRRFLFATSLLILLLFLIGAGISLGSADLSIIDSWRAVAAGLFPGTVGVSPELEASGAIPIVWELRLHRVLFAVAAGFGLAISGAVMQGILRNPLASPFTLGIASAAACGAAVAIVLGAGLPEGGYLVVGNAFLFALAASGAVYGMARARGMSAGAMILAGIAIMYLFSAVTSLLQYLGTTDQTEAIVFWMFGSLDRTSWGSLGIVTLILAVLTPWIVLRSWDLNALAEGEEVAAGLGIDPDRTISTFMVIASLITAAVICFTGTIGFIGLVAPHISRMVVGGDHRILIPTAGLTGAVLLLAADSVARTVLSPTILPVGIMTAFIGIPFFIYLFFSRGYARCA